MKKTAITTLNISKNKISLIFDHQFDIIWRTYFSNKKKRGLFNLLSPPADDLEDFLVSLFSKGFLLLTSVNFK